MIKNDKNFVIKDFEGPLDLLLFLIKSKKMDITELALVELADQFIDFIFNSKKINLNESSEYLLLASQLLEIKSRYFLNLEKSKEFRKRVKNTEDLLGLLIEYEQYKRISEEMFQYFKNHPQLDKKTDDFDEFVMNNADQVVSLKSHNIDDIEKAVSRIFQNTNKNRKINTTITVKRISVKDRREQLIKKFEKLQGKINFYDLFDKSDSKYMVAITLLCILDISNSKYIKIIQSNETIYVEKL